MATIRRFNIKGLQLKTTKQAVAPTHLWEAINCTLDTLGGVEKRRGFFNTATTTQAAISFGSGSFVVLNVLQNFLFAIGSTTIVRLLTQKGAIATATTLNSDHSFSNYVRTPTMLGTLSGTQTKRMFFIGYGDVPIHTDGTAANTTRSTMAVPTAPTTAVGAAGNPTGTYRYRITFVNDFGETTQGAVSGDVTVVSQRVELTSIATDTASTEPFIARARRIYRQRDGSDGLYHLVATLNDNTTTVYSDNITNAVVEADIQPPTINRASIIPSGQDGEVFFSRLYIGNNDTNTITLAVASPQLPTSVNIRPYRIWFSDVDNGIAFSANNFIDLPNSENIVAMKVLNNKLVIYTTTSIWEWDNFRLNQIVDNVGCLYRGSLIKGGQYHYFFGSKGFYRYGGGYPELISAAIDPIIKGIFATAVSSSAGSLVELNGTYHKGKCVWVTGNIKNTEGLVDYVAPASNAYTNAMLIYDTDLKEWVMWQTNLANNPEAVISHAYRSANTFEDEILYVGINGNGVFQYDSITSTGVHLLDEGVTGTSAFWNVVTAPDFAGVPERLKRFTRLSVHMKYGAGTSVLYRTDKNKNWKPVDDINGEVLDKAIDAVGYWLQIKLTHSGVTFPPVLEGFTFDAELEPSTTYAAAF